MELPAQWDDSDGEVAGIEGCEDREEAYRKIGRVLFESRPILNMDVSILAFI